MNSKIILTLLCMHIVGDFIFQNNKTDMYKSVNRYVIFTHTTLYSIPFVWFGGWFVLAVWIQHFLVDFGLPFIGKQFVEGKNELAFSLFFISDQIIHVLLLFLTYHIMIAKLF